MTYLIHLSDIRSQIIQLVKFPILWVDTEVADWYTPKPRLSLIQVLSNPADRTGETTYLFDVLDQPDAVQFFIHQIMMNQTIEKVFHNASFDLKYLGGKQAQNITCTLKLARQIPKNTLKASNCKLKTLAIELCHFTAVDIAEQQSDWGKRPLSAKQLLYAKMDTVYLAHVHQALLKLKQPSSPVISIPTPSPARSFSVTQIRVAFECPRLFYLAHHFNGKTLFLPSGKTSGIGSAFHDLSHQFIQTALNDSRFSEQFDAPVDQLDPEAISTQLQTLFFDQIFYQYLQSVTQASPAKAPALLQLWEGLKSLIHRWVKLLVNNRRYCSPSELFHKTFLAQELTVQHQFALPNGTSHWVKGRLDSLIYDFEHHRLCVVEYKTYQSPDRSAQLAQVALYSYMLREKIGVPINSAVYAVLPDWQESVFNWNDLEQTVHQLIPHKLQQMAEWVNWQPGEPNPPPPTAQLQLCEMCPQQTRCQTFLPQNSQI
jgi:S-DNA-T family DNA segregation ATPase FtsK/SpoIIIE